MSGISNSQQMSTTVVFNSQFILCSNLSTFFGFLCTIKQSMIYDRGPMPAGMQMVPTVLPDGRIGYVLQQLGFDETKPLPKGAEKKSFTKSKEEVSSLPKERIILEKMELVPSIMLDSSLMNCCS
ncbi:hypothetical protein P8452_75340 [Trifolium repens]|nr:hypothetical protein P8452_75340 [Trifolium repens]